MDGWNTIVSFWNGLFSGAFAVSFREGTFFTPRNKNDFVRVPFEAAVDEAVTPLKRVALVEGGVFFLPLLPCFQGREGKNIGRKLLRKFQLIRKKLWGITMFDILNCRY